MKFPMNKKNVHFAFSFAEALLVEGCCIPGLEPPSLVCGTISSVPSAGSRIETTGPRAGPCIFNAIEKMEMQNRRNPDYGDETIKQN
jgi:hypothetical protein